MSTFALVPAIASIALMYVLGTRMFASRGFGLVAAALFASTPLIWHDITSSPGALAPVPFVVLWLLVVCDVRTLGAARWFLAGAVLGLGVYTSTAAVVMMPLFMLLTLAVFVSEEAVSAAQLGMIVAGFAVAACPFAVFAARDAERFRTMVIAHHLYDAHRFNPLQGVHEMASWVGLTARSEMYYDYFNPAFLFLTGRVLLWPLAVLLPIGLYCIVSLESTALERLTLAGFFAAPFAAALTAERPIPERSLFITVFAALISTRAVQHLAALRKR